MISKDSYITGNRVYLRPLRKSDLKEEYCRWLNDLEVAKYIDSSAFPTTLDKLEEFYDQISKSKDEIILAIVDKKSDKHIGNIKLGPIDWLHRFAVMGVLIGDREFLSQGYGTEAIKLLVTHAFKRLNLNKIIIGVASSNIRAIKAYEKVGFKREGIGRKELFIDGEYEDSFHMGLLEEEFEY